MAELYVIRDWKRFSDNDLKKILDTLSKKDLTVILNSIIKEHELVNIQLKQFFVDNYRVKINGQQTGIEPYDETRKT